MDGREAAVTFATPQTVYESKLWLSILKNVLAILAMTALPHASLLGLLLVWRLPKGSVKRRISCRRR